MKNAAEEKSPGTGISPGSSAAVGSTVTRRAGSSPWTVTGVPASELLSSAPAARSMRSVWSRVGRRSITLVGPRASRPASNRHDFTCALATGERYSTPRSSAPRTVSGGRRSSVALTSAPISRSGSTIRSTGRRAIDSSPARVHSPCGLTGQPTGKDAHQGAGVTHVDEGMGLGAAQADAADPEVERRG